MIIIGEKENKRINCEEIFNGDRYEITFVDMGDYVGYKSRPWYQKSKPYWKPMSAEITTEDNTKIHYEALIDDHGAMLRIILEEGGGKRVMFFDKDGDDSAYNKVQNPDLKIWDTKFVNNILENLIESENQFKIINNIENEE